jgi:hypothetical protein
MDERYAYWLAALFERMAVTITVGDFWLGFVLGVVLTFGVLVAVAVFGGGRGS